jgi:3-deoxy-7-phosphoheptulonate synthase
MLFEDPQNQTVRVGPAEDLEIGPSAPIVLMAGPCTVEDSTDTLLAAAGARAAGATILRGGCFKPRTSPYSFQGMGKAGLSVLRWAADLNSLKVVTEVMDASQVKMVAAFADILQVGARNMQNYALLQALSAGEGKPVLLKRGIAATIEEWLHAAEYVLHAGAPVILCERGIRTFGNHTRFTLDVSSIPAVRRLSTLPIIVDPSHAAGHRHLVPALAKAAIAAGADGLLVEVHPCPERALCDGEQALLPEDLKALSGSIAAIAAAVGRRFKTQAVSVP